MNEINKISKQILFTENEIQQRINELAKEINEYYKEKELVLLGILKGSFIFLADLCRKLNIQHSVEFLAVSSYGNSTTSSGSVKILMDTRQDLSNKHILIVEDIVDTGYTLQYLLNLLKARNPASIECCVFLRKSKCIQVKNLELKWVGFEVDPIFVVGYGLDYAEKFRTLPFVCELKEEIYKKS